MWGGEVTRYFESAEDFLRKLLFTTTDAPIVRLTVGSRVVTPDDFYGEIIAIDENLGALVDTGDDFAEWFQAHELRAA